MLLNLVLGHKTFEWIKQVEDQAGLDVNAKQLLVTSLGAGSSVLQMDLFSLVRGDNPYVVCTFVEQVIMEVEKTPINVRNVLAAKKVVRDRGIFNNSRARNQAEMRSRFCHRFQSNSCPNRPGFVRAMPGHCARKEWGPCAFMHFCAACGKWGHGAIGCGLLRSKLKPRVTQSAVGGTGTAK